MRKILATLCVLSILVSPMPSFGANRNTNNGGTWQGNNNYDLCYDTDICTSQGQREAKKDNHTGTIVAVSVASAAVFAGAMWYIFKKSPSKNNPGLVRIAEF